MIVSRSPVRVPIGGGGTDLPSYYSKYGGALVTSTVNKHIYIIVKERFEDDIRVSYSKTEFADSIDQIQHPLVRETLRHLEIHRKIEIVSISDVPANTGMGTSSSFEVSLLNALHTYKKEAISPKDLAEEAYYIERIVLREAGGKQDQYAAAYGGFICLDIDKSGKVSVSRLKISPITIEELEDRLIFFYTGIKRSAAEIQRDHEKDIERGDEQVVNSLHMIKEIGLEIRKALENGELDYFGELLDKHWLSKKGMSANISTSSIDRWYQLAKSKGALGGKLMGAGGGGFLMFYCPRDTKQGVHKALECEGLRQINLRFEPDGSRILLHL